MLPILNQIIKADYFSKSESIPTTTLVRHYPTRNRSLETEKKNEKKKVLAMESSHAPYHISENREKRRHERETASPISTLPYLTQPRR